ncbi:MULTISPECIES: acylphosphatase [unclassified Halanaerobium]|uniref:acylphosphatase n=1 Tax=unclassified Halanaerobium TaxID=2641197 RepID=UPI000DF2A31D|nr:MULTISPECIES: acylphosphatase [unclassified Halanaerobium]RCW51537.1 acylphosphatase [Halanaerobium sp. MA284_MarDTE_T2]RCW89325.1 acylphosphatase [Halanaerobium sp. DL-01]
MSSNIVQKHIFVSGRVQGVGFRAFLRSQAAGLKIKGWAKNLRDGRVEIVIQGEKEKIKQMISFIKEGPSFADVKHIEIQDENLGEFEQFEIRF